MASVNTDSFDKGTLNLPLGVMAEKLGLVKEGDKDHIANIQARYVAIADRNGGQLPGDPKKAGDLVKGEAWDSQRISTAELDAARAKVDSHEGFDKKVIPGFGQIAINERMVDEQVTRGLLEAQAAARIELTLQAAADQNSKLPVKTPDQIARLGGRDGDAPELQAAQNGYRDAEVLRAEIVADPKKLLTSTGRFDELKATARTAYIDAAANLDEASKKPKLQEIAAPLQKASEAIGQLAESDTPGKQGAVEVPSVPGKLAAVGQAAARG